MMPDHRLSTHIRQFARNRIPAQLVIQFTTHCNARCPQCGMRAASGIKRSRLTRDAIKRILDAAADRNVQAVSFTGGEPLMFVDDLIDLIEHAGQLGIPYIRTGTNGFIFRGREKPDFKDRIETLAGRLAATSLRNFWISLDSADPRVHESMRGLPGVVDGIQAALPIFHKAGVFPSANLGLNRNVGGRQTAGLLPHRFGSRRAYLDTFHQCFRQALGRFYSFVCSLGFTMANTCYPMSIGEDDRAAGLQAVYAATAGDRVVRFSNDEKVMLYQALLDAIVRHRGRLRIFSPLSSIYMLRRQYQNGCASGTVFGCRGGVDFFFIDAADGDTYPCGYRGAENLGKFWQLDLSRIRPGNDCLRCDWECFRDPSEMCAPLLQAASSPLNLVGRLRADPAFFAYWLQDMRYYQACRYFDGRIPPDFRRLKKFR
jgi:MoaA/NifB/PqqE/SkfB family radical SAM enzyme